LVFVLLASVYLVASISRKYPDWGLTPGGYRHKSCIHHVPSGSHLDVHEDGTVTVLTPSATTIQIPKCKFPKSKYPGLTEMRSYRKGSNSMPGEVEGWHVYTKQNVGNNLNLFLGTWNVPDLPANDGGQTLFTFTGVQNIDWIPPNPGPNSAFDIIQPVLQYGESEAGGGSYWTLASWYVPLSNGDSAIWSDLITVNSGDVIFGNMTMTGPATWYINSLDTTTGQNTDMTMTKPILKAQPWAYVTLEVYDLFDDCTEYPTVPLNFTQLQLQVGGRPQPFQWQTIQADNTCNQEVTVVNPTNVIISF